jgi:hypothetical protein
LVLSCSTDTFTGDDAGGDGSGANDGTASDGGGTDGGGVSDGSKIDAIVSEGGTSDASAGCLNLGQTSGCGSGAWCTGEACCATEAGAQCTGSSCLGTAFMCRDTADCATLDAGVLSCCLNNAAVTPDICPRQIKSGAAACAISCPSYKLCNSTSECQNLKTCQRATVPGSGENVGICL